MAQPTNIRMARMRSLNGPGGGASIDGVSYPANADGTITVPTGRQVGELQRHGFVVEEVIEPTTSEGA